MIAWSTPAREPGEPARLGPVDLMTVILHPGVPVRAPLGWGPADVIDRIALALLPWLEGEPDPPCIRFREPEAGQ